MGLTTLETLAKALITLPLCHIGFLIGSHCTSPGVLVRTLTSGIVGLGGESSSSSPERVRHVRALFCCMIPITVTANGTDLRDVVHSSHVPKKVHQFQPTIESMVTLCLLPETPV